MSSCHPSSWHGKCPSRLFLLWDLVCGSFGFLVGCPGAPVVSSADAGATQSSGLGGRARRRGSCSSRLWLTPDSKEFWRKVTWFSVFLYRTLKLWTRKLGPRAQRWEKTDVLPTFRRLQAQQSHLLGIVTNGGQLPGANVFYSTHVEV